MSDRDTAGDFLQNYLPREIPGLINLTELAVVKETFVEPELKAMVSAG